MFRNSNDTKVKSNVAWNSVDVNFDESVVLNDTAVGNSP